MFGIISSKNPLSRAPGRAKLLVAAPLCLLFGVLSAIGVATDICTMVAISFGAFALVGLIEVLLGSSLLRASNRWDDLAAWKKFAISLIVIGGALVLAVTLIPAVSSMGR